MPIRLVPIPWDCQPLEAGVIAEPYRRGLLLAADADQRVPVFAALGRNRAIGGVRGASKSGAGWTTDASNYVRAVNDSGADTSLFEIPANSSWTVQLVVENIGGSGTNPGFFRSNSAGTGTTFLLQDGTTRRAWVRVNSTDILRPSSGAQWTTGQKLNLIVRCQNATRVEAWWDGTLQHSATHSTSQEALTGADAIYALYSHQQGGSGAQTTTGTVVASRAWARYLDDQEMHALARDELALYEPRRIWVPVSAGATPRSATASLSVAVQQARTATSSVAAAIQAGRTASASVAAAVQLGRTATASAAAAVQAPRTATASVATAVQDAHTASAALAAAVQRGVTATASIAAALQAARTATASASAAVQESHTATASVTAYVQAGQTVSASLSAAVQAARTAQASVAAAVQAPHTAQASLATAIAEARSVTTSLAAAVQQARSTSASISAQIQAGTTVVAQINAAILDARTASASIAAAVAVARSASASLAAAVAVSATLTAAIQAAVLRARSATAAVAAYISTPGDHTIAPRLYLVDAQDRAYLIDPEDRTYIVPASDRSSAA